MHSPTKREGRQAKATGSSFYLGQKEVHHTLKEGSSLLSLLWNVPIDLPQRSAYKLISDSIYFSARTNHHRKMPSSAFTNLNQQPRADLQDTGLPLWEEPWSGRIGGEAGRNLNRCSAKWDQVEKSSHPEEVVNRSCVGTLCVVTISSTTAGPLWGWRVGQLH